MYERQETRRLELLKLLVGNVHDERPTFMTASQVAEDNANDHKTKLVNVVVIP